MCDEEWQMAEAEGLSKCVVYGARGLPRASPGMVQIMIRRNSKDADYGSFPLLAEVPAKQR